MNSNLARRLFIFLAAGFFIISTISTIGCAGSKLKVEYEKKDNSEVIGPNTITGIIRPVRFIMTAAGNSIFI